MGRAGARDLAGRPTCSRGWRNGAVSNMGNQLSGGEQQMLAIARSLLTNPWYFQPLRFSARLALSWSNRCV